MSDRSNQDVDALIEDYLGRVIPISRQAALADWKAATTGDTQAYESSATLHKQFEALHADAETFSRLGSLRENPDGLGPLRYRQIEILYRRYLAAQLPGEIRDRIIDLSSTLERRFATFRGRIDERPVTDNEIDETLRTETDSRRLRQYWEASKQVGQEVAGQVVELVELRNEAARRLGYRDHFQLKLDLDEIDEAWLMRTFDDLDRRTRASFEACKARIDEALGHRYRLRPGDLMPWHYQNRFFQDAPWLGELDVDAPFHGQRLQTVIGGYYRGLGLDADGIIDRSDLYEREGKNPHAFCIDIDRSGDIRTLQNLQANAAWADTFLHELGHGVYAKYVNRELPWLLRTENHTLTTEGVALLFGRFASNADWLVATGLIEPAERSAWRGPLDVRSRFQALVFSRWTQVMLRFERQLYADPHQDLNELWWSLVERYQGLHRPPRPTAAADWAAKIHVALYPVYYHNYQLGELYASQLHATVCREVFGRDATRRIVYAGRREVGELLIERVFKPGATQHWSAFVKSSTGAELSPAAFADEFVRGD